MKAILLSLLSIIFFGGVSFAQNISSDVSLTAIPDNPEPLSVVEISATSFSVDLNNHNIEWSYNNKVIASGTGKKSIKVTAPEAGGTAIVSVKIYGEDFETIVGSTVIRPGSVDMLWEAVDSYVPPFYKGKPLLSYGGIVRVTAIPGTASPKTTVFNWKRNSIPMESLSGFGKSSIIFKQKELDSIENISVETGGSTLSGRNSITIEPVLPSIIAYQNSEGFIDYMHGWLENIPIIGTGALLRFEPYFFSAPVNLVNDLDMKISVDGAQVNTGGGNEVSLSAENGTEGEVNVSVFTKEYSLQNAKTIFGIKFN